jgi:hypothetical protein
MLSYSPLYANPFCVFLCKQYFSPREGARAAAKVFFSLTPPPHTFHELYHEFYAGMHFAYEYIFLVSQFYNGKFGFIVSLRTEMPRESWLDEERQKRICLLADLFETRPCGCQRFDGWIKARTSFNIWQSQGVSMRCA